MPLIACSAAEAYERTLGNKVAAYPKPNRGRSRLVPVPSIEHVPKFALDKSQSVYAIGSCFARNVEQRLAEAGFRVASIPTEDSPLHDVPGGATFFNKYPPQAIEQELRWALDPMNPFPAPEAFVEVGDGLYCDPHMGGALTRQPLDELAQVRAKYESHVRSIRECPIVVVTLGLVECWFDRDTQLFLNQAPPRSALRRSPDRFEFQVSSYPEVLGSLERSYAHLKEHGHPDVKMLLTVSPVPLARTFRSDDILQASCYSKSVLRAAAEAFVQDKPNVAYFPSYEMVTLANRAAAWLRTDYRHPHPDMVRHIMNRVMTAYIGEEVAPAIGRLAQGRLLYRLGQYEAAIEQMKPLTREEPGFEAVWTVGRAMARLDRPEESLEYMRLAAKLRPGKQTSDALAKLLDQLGRTEEAARVREQLAAAEDEQRAAREREQDAETLASRRQDEGPAEPEALRRLQRLARMASRARRKANGDAPGAPQQPNREGTAGMLRIEQAVADPPAGLVTAFEALKDQESKKVLASVLQAHAEGDPGCARVSGFARAEHPQALAAEGNIVACVGIPGDDWIQRTARHVGPSGHVHAFAQDLAEYEAAVEVLNPETNLTLHCLNVTVSADAKGHGASGVWRRSFDDWAVAASLDRLGVLSLSAPNPLGVLAGARKAIAKFLPKLHVDLGTRFSSGLLDVPEWCVRELPSYRWYMGHHGPDGLQLSLYGAPPEPSRARLLRKAKKLLRHPDRFFLDAGGGALQTLRAKFGSHAR